MYDQSVIVVGGGIAGLTASALLAKEGFSVTLVEAHYQTGGCAGTFRRGPYIFDVGATQVAGLEVGGIHERLFRHLQIPLPDAEILSSACLVDLGDGENPVQLWYEPEKWKEERNLQFPGSESFWELCSFLHRSNWAFASRDPVLPVRNTWDALQSLKALSPLNLTTGLISRFSVLDLLKICRCHKDKRLRKFLDLQLRLYSQENTERTAALYGATVLQIAQSPHGLWHLKGSMQKLSDLLKDSFIGNGGKLLLNHRVTGLEAANSSRTWNVQIVTPKGDKVLLGASDVVFSLPPQCLLKLMPNGLEIPKGFKKRLERLPKPTGALVFYGAMDRQNLGDNFPSHLQFNDEDLGSLFLSISREGDGRAPSGKATIIASLFAESRDWIEIDEEKYRIRKETFLSKILLVIQTSLKIPKESWLHKELATPRSFARWTGRPDGIVGGIGQHPNVFGPFGLPSRTPLRGLWLCGDSIYPGEGTAGVSQSALMATRQLMATKGLHLIVDQ